MNMRAGDIDLIVCCVFCRKRLPTLNGELQAWRSPDGQLFCDEFQGEDAHHGGGAQRDRRLISGRHGRCSWIYRSIAAHRTALVYGMAWTLPVK
jgi:hypothetical protein